MTLSPQAVWAKNMFELLAEWGTWGIPRSGLIFQKRGEQLVLVNRMPWMPEMGDEITEHELRLQQDREFDENRKWFGEAGIPIIDETKEA